MSKITLENQHGKYTIEINEDIESIGDYVDFLVKPILSAAGFSEKLTNEYIGGE